MKKTKKIVIVGGMAAGPKAAARARRLLPEAEITVLEQGELISYGTCGLPLYLSGIIPDIGGLSSTPVGLTRDVKYFDREKNVRFLTGTRAVYIDRETHTVVYFDRKKKKESEIIYDELVLATGAEPFLPDIPGIESKGVITLRQPEDARMIKASLKEGVKKIAVIGAGLIGVETAAALAGREREIILIEKDNQILPGVLDQEFSHLVCTELKDNGVRVLTGEVLRCIKGDGGSCVREIATDKGIYNVDLIILACGVKPNVQLALKCGLAVGSTGAIKVNEYLQTSDPCIYAGGDCVENIHLISGKSVFVPLASTANKHGRVIGSNLGGLKEVFPGVLGTVALQIFDYNAGKTGLTEVEAREAGYPIETVIVSGHDSAHYYPMHGRGSIKLIAHAETGKLLGAQVAGNGEVIKRLDVLATAIQLRANLSQLSQLDLGYAPPFATPIDLSIHGVNTLRNIQQGLVKGVFPCEMERMMRIKENFLILDVRTSEEVTQRPVLYDRVIHIPLSDLRARSGALSRAEKIITVCHIGVRAYEAACLLKGKGFDQVAFLEGGLSTLPKIE